MVEVTFAELPEDPPLLPMPLVKQNSTNRLDVPSHVNGVIACDVVNGAVPVNV